MKSANKKPFAHFTRQSDAAKPVTIAKAIDKTRLGIRIHIEFMKPTLTPPQLRPEQACVHADIQASIVQTCGRSNVRPRRISSMDLKDVTTTT